MEFHKTSFFPAVFMQIAYSPNFIGEKYSGKEVGWKNKDSEVIFLL